MKPMTKIKTIGALSAVCLAGLTAQAQSIDTFDGDLSAYTATRILKASSGAADNVYSWEISGGSLQIATSSYGGIEQYALTRTDAPLNVGYELTATYSGLNLDSQDIGLYVGAATPTPDVRQDYVDVYIRNNGQVFSRGFDGTSELSLTGGGTPTVSSLFVAHTDLGTYELGYYESGTRNVITTRTMSNTAIGDVIGFYADIRGAGTRGNLDNLTIAAIPEPSTFAMLLLGGVASAIGLRRRK